MLHGKGTLSVGDIVALPSAFDEASIPAARAMRGRVTWMSADSADCKVSWFDGGDGRVLGADVMPRKVDTVVRATRLFRASCSTAHHFIVEPQKEEKR
jgi:hypothetical protein